MKPPWHVRRSTVAQHDGARRWDEASQFLLPWTMEDEAGTRPAPSHPQEDTHGSCSVCAGLNGARRGALPDAQELLCTRGSQRPVNNSTRRLPNHLAVPVTRSPPNPLGMSPTSTSPAPTETAEPLSSDRGSTG